MEDSVASADVGQKCVAQTLSLCCALDQSSDVDYVQESWNLTGEKEKESNQTRFFCECYYIQNWASTKLPPNFNAR